MDYDAMCQKARDIYKVASHPAFADILYPHSIRAEWNAKFDSFDSVSVSGIKSHRTTPNLNERFRLRFLAGDPTDENAVRTRVAKRLSEIGRTKKDHRGPKRH